MQSILPPCGLMNDGPGATIPHKASFLSSLGGCAHSSVLVRPDCCLIGLSILQNAILFVNRFRTVPAKGRGHILAGAGASRYGGLADSVILYRVNGPLLGLALEPAVF